VGARNRYKGISSIVLHTFVYCVLLGPVISTAQAQNSKPDITVLSLENLSSIEITSVSRREQKLTEAAGAVYIITSEDIRRSGLNSLPELLRTVPGLDVAQIDGNKWAITARGFNERFADKMLVLLDGRTLYTPLTSGVNWDVQETLLEDVERIEIIRGPGATLWGSNAVDGVVNIITRKSKDTQGTLLTGTVSARDRNSIAVRNGGTFGANMTYRVFGKYFDKDGSQSVSGGAAPDGWHDLRAGFRTDWDISEKTTLTVQGDLYRARVGQTVPGIVSLSPPVTGVFIDKTITSGGNILGRWTKSSSRLESTVQGYFDLENRDQRGLLGEFRHTLDLEFDQRYHPGRRHDFIWGGDFRHSSDRTVGSLNISFNPASRATDLYGIFAQDEIAFFANKLRLTLGSKMEHNFYSGFAFQPNFRMVWTPSERVSTWTAVSRASENSSRTDADIRTNDDPVQDAKGNITLSSHFGLSKLPPENVNAYELGTRYQPNHVLNFDLATFYNHYTNRHTNEPGAPFLESDPLPLHLVIPTYTRSNISGETHGLELLVKAQPARAWSVSASYTLFEIHLHQIASSLDFDTARESEGSSPHHQFQVRSSLNLPHKVEFDSAIYYVGPLDGPGIKAYTRLDLRAGWHPAHAIELSAGGRNLLQAEHAEFGSGDLVQAEAISRSAFLKATWSF